MAALLALAACAPRGAGPGVEAAAWRVETVDDAGDAGTGLSFLVDSAGILRATWYDHVHGDVVHGDLLPGGWRRERVADGATWTRTGLAVGADGSSVVLHFSGKEGEPRRLSVARKGPEGWESRVLEVSAPGDALVRFAGPVVTADGATHVAFTRSRGAAARAVLHGRLSPSGEWVVSTVVEPASPTTDLTLLAGRRSEVWLVGGMVLDPEGPTARNVLAAARLGPSGWALEEVAPLTTDPVALGGWWSERGVRLGAGIGPDGALTVSFPRLDSASPAVRLEVAERGPGGWTVERVDWVGAVGRQSSLDHGPGGTLWVAYRNGTNGDLRAASRPPGGTWRRATVDAGTDTGDHPALRVAPDGRVHILYRKAADGGVWRAWSGAGGEWEREAVDVQGEVGRFASLAALPDGTLLATYREGPPNLDLKAATLAPGARSWSRERVAMAGDSGDRAGLAVGAAGERAVAYSAGPFPALMCAVWTEGRWAIETVAEGEIVGSRVAAAWAPDGGLHLLWLEPVRGDLRHAVRIAGRWTVSTVASPGSVGGGVALASSPTGAMHALYTDAVDGSLSHATLAEGGWRGGGRVAAGQFGPNISLAAAPDGTMHASAHRRGGGGLTHLWLAAGAWRWEQVAAGTEAGLESAMAVGPDGTAHLAYKDGRQNALLVASKPPGGSWVSEVVATGEEAGSPALAVTPDGTVHLAYREGAPSHSLRHARRAR